MNPSDNILNISIEDLFKDPEESLTPEELAAKAKETSEDDKSKDLTKTMSERINKVRANTEKETQERIAKELGYENYEAMKAAQTKKIVTDHGYDPEDIEKVIEPLLAKRLADDPRFKELEALKERDKQLYIENQLAAINETTGQKLTIDDLPKETIDLWSKGIELEQAYYATQGKKIVLNVKNKLKNGSLEHLAPGSQSGSVKTRALTEQEKRMWRSIVPGITEEELSKKTTEIK